METPNVGNHQHDEQSKYSSLHRLVGKRLSHSKSSAIDSYTDQPIACKLQVGYQSMFKLRVAVSAEHKQVIGMMAHLWINVVQFKIGLTVPLFESKGAKLALTAM
jgi:hypothetical protein